MTVKDFFVSFTQNMRDKSKNPFFGTLILVWILKNWRLVYSIFTFDSSFTLDQRLNYLNNYFIENPFKIGLFYVVLWTFLAIIISYFLINATRLIVDFFEKRVTPTVLKWNDKYSIVSRELYNKEILKNEELERKYQSEREERIRKSNELEELERKLYNKTETSEGKKKVNARGTDEYLLSQQEYSSIEEKIIENKWIEEVLKMKQALDVGNKPNIPDDLFKLFSLTGLIERKDPGTNRSRLLFTEKGIYFMKIFVDLHYLKNKNLYLS